MQRCVALLHVGLLSVHRLRRLLPSAAEPDPSGLLRCHQARDVPTLPRRHESIPHAAVGRGVGPEAAAA
jgi:hypothetical protein